MTTLIEADLGTRDYVIEYITAHQMSAISREFTSRGWEERYEVEGKQYCVFRVPGTRSGTMGVEMYSDC
jgi:hypothetical protein